MRAQQPGELLSSLPPGPWAQHLPTPFSACLQPGRDCLCSSPGNLCLSGGSAWEGAPWPVCASVQGPGADSPTQKSLTQQQQKGDGPCEWQVWGAFQVQVHLGPERILSGHGVCASHLCFFRWVSFPGRNEGRPPAATSLHCPPV